jgi:hypothetical protein
VVDIEDEDKDDGIEGTVNEEEITQPQFHSKQQKKPPPTPKAHNY